MEFSELKQRLISFDQKEIGQGASSSEIQRAQDILGVIFPDDYAAFLREYGWASIGYWEIYGLGTDVPAYLNLIEVTLSERQEMEPNLPNTLIPLMNDGGGNLYCLDTSQCVDSICQVVYWDHERGSHQQPEKV